MSNIIGDFIPVTSTLSPIDAHVGHLRHLTNQKIAKEILRDRHKLTVPQANETSKLLAAHIAQALEFHFESRTATASVRPVLQYYAYLNLSVAAILAYRPDNFQQYRRHGVEDKTYSLSRLELSSKVLEIKRGAVPLFHSIVSDVPLFGKKFRFGQLAAGFHMCSHELQTRFNKKSQKYYVEDRIIGKDNAWYSCFSFSEYIDEKWKKVPQNKIQNAMPILLAEYNCDTKNQESTIYISKKGWSKRSSAEKIHQKNGIKLINYGGHLTTNSNNSVSTSYIWHGVSNSAFVPTLTSMLLMSFSLSSIARYRPILLDSSMNSPISLIVDTFVSESDSVFIPSLRNLLYREEVVVGTADFI